MSHHQERGHSAPNRIVVHTVNGVCGSFKTTRAIEWAARASQQRQQIVIASPSMTLIKQSFEFARSLGADCYRFDSETHAGAVYADLVKFFDDRPAGAGGCIVFITHKALFDMPYFGKRQGDWDLVIDEIPQPDRDWCWNLRSERLMSVVTDCLDAVEADQNLYLRIKIKTGQRGYVNAIATNPKGDTITSWMQEFRDLCQDLLSAHTEVWVSRASWNELRYRGGGQLIMHSVRLPTVLAGWRSVHLLGAHVDDSVLKLLWSQEGVRFRKSRVIKADAEAHDEALGKRIDLYYFSAKRWSRNLFASLGGRGCIGEKAVSALEPILRDAFGDEPFVYALNNIVPDQAMAGFPNAERIPNSPHGLNEFRHHTNAFFGTCLLNRPAHFKFLFEMYGIDGDRLAKARYYEFAYQGFLRTDARNASSTKRLKFVIPDIDAANHFTAVFPGCRLIALTAPRHITEVVGPAFVARGNGRKQPAKDNATKCAEHRARMAELRVIKGRIEDMLFRHSTDTDGTIRIYPNRCRSPLRFSHEANVFSQVIANSLADWEDFRVQMRGLSEHFCPKKEEATLMSGASFAPKDGVETSKGLANVTEVNGIEFDVDGGEMKPADWAVIFPEFKFLGHNSFNNGVDGATKYRVIFPTALSMSADQYHYVWDGLVARIRQTGFYIGSKANFEKYAAGGRHRFSGIDPSKRPANSMFYLPARAGLGKKYTFFMEHWDDSTAILDPVQFLNYDMPIRPSYDIVEPYANPTTGSLRAIREKLVNNEDRPDKTQQQIDAAMKEWLAGPPGHNEMVRLAKRLAKVVPINEAKIILEREARRDPKGTRKTEVRGISTWAHARR